MDKKLGDKARCKFCGRTGHGKNPDTKARKKSCPAFEKLVLSVKKQDTSQTVV